MLAYRFCTDGRKRRSWIRWSHSSYSVCCVKDAIILSHLHPFSVYPAETGNGAGFEKVRMGENGSNTLREYAFFFSKTEKKSKCGRGLSQIKTNPPGVEFVINIFKFDKLSKRESCRRFFTLSMWGWNLAISRRRGAVPTKKCTKTCAALGKVVVLLI